MAQFSRWYRLLSALVCLVCLVAVVHAEDGARLAQLLAQPGVRPGLCVHVTCGNGEATAKLGETPGFLVQGLTTAAVPVALLPTPERPVTLRRYDGRRLPYVDALVNTLILEATPSTLGKGLTWAEAARVVTPYGTLFFQQVNKQPEIAAVQASLTPLGFSAPQPVAGVAGWWYTRKAYPANTDEWTHFEHDAGRTSVSKDQVAAPPQGLQWIADTAWPTYVVFSESGEGFVSTRGRNIYWITDNPGALRGVRRSRLVARDAYNGLLLWERSFPNTVVPLNMVADGETIFLHLGAGRLHALDAVTGETVKTYDKAIDCNQLLYRQGYLVQYSRLGRLSVLNAKTGDEAWSRTQPAEREWTIGQDRLVVGDDVIFLIARQEKLGPLFLYCHNLADGTERWSREITGLTLNDTPLTTCHLVSYTQGVLLVSSTSRGVRVEAGPCANYALNARDGTLRWQFAYTSTGHGGLATNVLTLGETVWVKTRLAWVGLDLQTGKERASIKDAYQQCYPDRATERFIMGGQMHFADTVAEKNDLFAATRSSCGSGIMPANGEIYTFPTRCFCFPIVRGYLGLAPLPSLTPEETPLQPPTPEHGPAFGTPVQPPVAGEWPVYRHDSTRGGATNEVLPKELAVQWTTALPAPVTAPVIAGGRVYVAERNHGRVWALQADTGAKIWSYTTGAVVDSPPTIAGNRVYFGSADGWLYCLEAERGTLVWRLRLAPNDRQLLARELLESVWPVHGSVLVEQGLVYCAAGRHSYIDGGIVLYAVNAETGAVAWIRQVARAEGSTLEDLLQLNGTTLYMSNLVQLNTATGALLRGGTSPAIWSPQGMLQDYSHNPIRGGNDNWFGMWVYAEKTNIAQFDKNFAHPLYSRYKGVRASLLVVGGGRAFTLMQHYAAKTDATPTTLEVACKTVAGGAQWATPVPGAEVVRLNAMALTADTLYVAGIVTAEEGKGTGKLYQLKREDGTMQAELPLPAGSRWDGLAIASGRLFVATEDGKVVCLGKK